MKNLINQSVLIKAAIIALVSVSFSAQADLDIQSAQYNPEKVALFVKGRLSAGALADQVFILDATNNAFIGTLETKSNKRQFGGDLEMPSHESVPCVVKVQINPPRRRRGPSGDFDISVVRQAPEHCEQ